MTGRKAMLDKIKLQLPAKSKTVTVEPDGHRGCIFIMNLPAVRDACVRFPEVLADPWPVMVWISFN